MKITTKIDNKDYIFELDRNTYKKLLQDEQYSKIKDELSVQMQGVKTEEDVEKEMIKNSYSKSELENLILLEQVFYYSLLKHQPDMTPELASNLMDKIIEEDGSMEYVTDITTKIMNSFFGGAVSEKKPKRVLIID